MGGVSKTFAMAVTSVSVAVILAILFAWVGPGLDGVANPASAHVLYDEDQVQAIYQRVSPAVVEVTIEETRGDFTVQSGFGSGFLIDREGHIVTNNHVITGAERIQVRFIKGSTAEASVVGTNPASDLALLKVAPEAAADIEPVELADSSQVRPGQLALAIGNPFQMEGTVTAGIISGLNRSLPSDLGRSIPGVLQTDALIGPGNSGGPLLNSAGQVVGINTAIEVPYKGASYRRGAGFAVPINSLVRVLPRLKSEHSVRPPWLGVSVAGVDRLRAQGLDLPVDRGAYVTAVASGSPAQEAGVVASDIDLNPDGTARRSNGLGDVIVAAAGVAVESVADLVSQLDRHQPGDQIALTVVRDGEEMELSVTLGQWPEQRDVQADAHPFRRKAPNPGREFWSPSEGFQFDIPGFHLPDLLPVNPRR